jgi:hypothetical protein
MRRISLPLAFLGALLVCVMDIAPAQAQAPRTWVSGIGDDANPCSRTAPCKTFTGAISKTAASGVINCLDPGGFGSVTITKSITIDCHQTMGSIVAIGTNGITIQASGATVALRGLDFEGMGGGLIGISILDATAVSIDDIVINQSRNRASMTAALLAGPHSSSGTRPSGIMRAPPLRPPQSRRQMPRTMSSSRTSSRSTTATA